MQTLKSLFVTLLLLGGAFLAYDYYLAPAADKMVFKQPPAKPVTASPAAPAPPAPVPQATVTTPAPASGPKSRARGSNCPGADSVRNDQSPADQAGRLRASHDP